MPLQPATASRQLQKSRQIEKRRHRRARGPEHISGLMQVLLRRYNIDPLEFAPVSQPETEPEVESSWEWSPRAEPSVQLTLFEEGSHQAAVQQTVACS